MRKWIGAGLAAATLVAIPVAASMDWPWFPSADSGWNCKVESFASVPAESEIPAEAGVSAMHEVMMLQGEREELTFKCERWVYRSKGASYSLSMNYSENLTSEMDPFIGTNFDCRSR